MTSFFVRSLLGPAGLIPKNDQPGYSVDFRDRQQGE
jgi:hypothetical protein